MNDLTDFLLARIAEDEAAAEAAAQAPGRGGVRNWYWSNAGEAVFLDGTSTSVVWGDGHSRPAGNHIVRHDPARSLAECKAKRGIVRMAADALENDHAGLLEAVVKLLASSYADHRDYDEAWRP